VPLVTVKRCVKLHREVGEAFFAPVKKRSGSKLTADVCQQAQDLLDQGLKVPEVDRQLGILANTLHKAIGMLNGASIEFESAQDAPRSRWRGPVGFAGAVGSWPVNNSRSTLIPRDLDI
jgi:hypothetical protein